MKRVALYAASYRLWDQGRLAEAVESCELGMAIAPSGEAIWPVGMPPLDAGYRFLSIKGAVLAESGKLAEAGRALERAIALARAAANDPAQLAWIHTMCVDWAGLVGDPRIAIRHGRNAVEIEEEVGSIAGLIMAYGGLGKAFVLSQRWDEAENALTHAISMVRDRHTGLNFLPRALVCLARSHLARGDTEAAEAAIGEAIELVGQVAVPRQANQDRIEARLAQAELWLRTEGAEARQQIDAILETVATWIEARGARACARGLRPWTSRPSGFPWTWWGGGAPNRPAARTIRCMRVPWSWRAAASPSPSPWWTA